jgi:hypothetical protein
MQRKYQMRAAWIFGSLTLIFLMVVYLRGGNTHDPVIRLIAAILAGLMGYFITGSMRLVSEGRIASWGKISIQAGGGAAFFTLVFLSWPKEPVVNPNVLGKDAAVAVLNEILKNPAQLDQLVKAANHKSLDDPDIQELIGLRRRLEIATDHLESVAKTMPLPEDIREQLTFAQKALSKLKITLFRQFTTELRTLIEDETPLNAIVPETGVPAVEDLQLRLLLPKAKLKEELPNGFWSWSPDLRASWVDEASDYVSLVPLEDPSEAKPQDILCFEKPSDTTERANAVHFDGSVGNYSKDDLMKQVKKQVREWRPAWETRIVFSDESGK